MASFFNGRFQISMTHDDTLKSTLVHAVDNRRMPDQEAREYTMILATNAIIEWSLCPVVTVCFSRVASLRF